MCEYDYDNSAEAILQPNESLFGHVKPVEKLINVGMRFDGRSTADPFARLGTPLLE